MRAVPDRRRAFAQLVARIAALGSLGVGSNTGGCYQHMRSRVVLAIKSRIAGNRSSDYGRSETCRALKRRRGLNRAEDVTGPAPGTGEVSGTSLPSRHIPEGKGLGNYCPWKEKRGGNWLLLIGQTLSLLCGKV